MCRLAVAVTAYYIASSAAADRSLAPWPPPHRRVRFLVNSAPLAAEPALVNELPVEADIPAIRAGDAAAFAAAFDMHALAIHRYCARRCEGESAEDLTSVVFLEAWRTRARAVSVDASLRPWLLAIARNVVRNSNRAQRRYAAALDRLHSMPIFSADDEISYVDRVAEAQSLRDELKNAIAALTRKQQEVVELCLVEHLSPAAAAQVLDIPEGTVKSRLAAARCRLQGLLRSGEFAAWTDPTEASGHHMGGRRGGVTAARETASWTY